MQCRIVCDNGCDFAVAERLGAMFRRVPVMISVEDQQFVDDGTLQLDALVKALKDTKTRPVIAGPTTEQYVAALEGEWENCFVVTASSALWNSYDAAFAAVTSLRNRDPQRKVHVFNSRSLSAGELVVARKVRELKLSGNDYREIVEQVERFIPSMHTYLLPGKNGKLVIGQADHRTMLPFGRAVLQSTPSGGFTHCFQAGTYKQMLHRLRDRIIQYPTENRLCVISHAACPDQANALATLLRQSCKFREILVVPASGVTTACVYPNGIVVAF